MLAHILAVAVGLGSVTLYLAAFFFPEVHRKHDFFWSGVGCFYALVLWVDAGQITATELLGHLAGVALVAWFGWQTLTLRRKRTPRDLQTPLTDKSWQVFGQDLAAISTAWLKRTPLGRFLGSSAGEKAYPPVTKGGFRASSLKQVDYEFLDELPPHHNGTLKSKVTQPEAGSSPSIAAPADDLNRSGPATRQRSVSPAKSVSKAASQTPRPPQKPVTLLQRGIVLKDWLVEVVTTATKPKPKKPVIVIPPRESAPNQPSASPGAADLTDLSSAQKPAAASPDGESPEDTKAGPAKVAPAADSPEEVAEPARDFDGPAENGLAPEEESEPD